MSRLCRCGHPREAHQHFRSGSDCGACGAQECSRYRARRAGLLGRLLGGTASGAPALRLLPRGHAARPPAADGDDGTGAGAAAGL